MSDVHGNANTQPWVVHNSRTKTRTHGKLAYQRQHRALGRDGPYLPELSLRNTKPVEVKMSRANRIRKDSKSAAGSASRTRSELPTPPPSSPAPFVPLGNFSPVKLATNIVSGFYNLMGRRNVGNDLPNSQEESQSDVSAMGAHRSPTKVLEQTFSQSEAMFEKDVDTNLADTVTHNEDRIVLKRGIEDDGAIQGSKESMADVQHVKEALLEPDVDTSSTATVMYDEDPVHMALDGGVEGDGAIHSDEESMVGVQYAQEAMLEQDVDTPSADTVHMDLNGDVEDDGAIQGSEEVGANIQHVPELSTSAGGNGADGESMRYNRENRIVRYLLNSAADKMMNDDNEDMSSEGARVAGDDADVECDAADSSEDEWNGFGWKSKSGSGNSSEDDWNGFSWKSKSGPGDSSRDGSDCESGHGSKDVLMSDLGDADENRRKSRRNAMKIDADKNKRKHRRDLAPSVHFQAPERRHIGNNNNLFENNGSDERMEECHKEQKVRNMEKGKAREVPRDPESRFFRAITAQDLFSATTSSHHSGPESQPYRLQVPGPSNASNSPHQPSPSPSPLPGSDSGLRQQRCNDFSGVSPSIPNDSPLRRSDLLNLEELMVNRLRKDFMDEMTHLMKGFVDDFSKKHSETSGSHHKDPSAKEPTSSMTPEGEPPLPRKVKVLPCHRSSSSNEFNKGIREFGYRLLGIEKMGLPKPVSSRRIRAWDPKQGPCCTAKDFRIDILGFPRSEWNVSAAKVFAAAYLSEYKDCQLPQKKISDAWLQRVAAMRTQYRLEQESKQARREHAADHRRRQRKSELYHRRLQCARRFSTLKAQAVPILEVLNVDGMSSDESDHEGHKGEATYYILDKEWRSKKIDGWMHLLDSLHLYLRYKGEWQASPGAWPHFRSVSLRDSKRSAVAQLPKDFYDRNWYASQNKFVRQELQVTDSRVSLDIPKDVSLLAEKYNIRDRMIVAGKAAL